jgi:hypothetical protein
VNEGHLRDGMFVTLGALEQGRRRPTHDPHHHEYQVVKAKGIGQTGVCWYFTFMLAMYIGLGIELWGPLHGHLLTWLVCMVLILIGMAVFTLFGMMQPEPYVNYADPQPSTRQSVPRPRRRLRLRRPTHGRHRPEPADNDLSILFD